MEVNEIIENGRKICNENPFYNTLSLLLKYYFISNTDINLMELIRDVTKSEMEFQVFMVYKNYATDLYLSNLNFFQEKLINFEEITYYLIWLIKDTYDKDRTVISPYVSYLDTNKIDVINNYHMIKTTYTVKQENINNLMEITEIINLLENAKKLEKSAIEEKEKALTKLYKLHKKTYKIIGYEDIKLLK